MPEHHNYQASDSTLLLQRCIEHLQAGSLVCLPTDTVYGFICDPNHPATVQRLYELKQRPAQKPFALFVTVENAFASPLLYPTKSAHRLTKRFWPGALTIVIPASEKHPCTNAGKVGLRSPNYTFLQKILPHFHEGLINTSVNLSGQPPVTSLRGMESLLEQADFIIDAGELPPSQPSTVVDCSSHEVKILRHGAIEEEKIRAVLSHES